MVTGRYRSIFHTGPRADEAFPAAEQQLRGWLGEKGLDQDAFDRGMPKVGPAGQALLVLARNAMDGTQTKRWQLREPNDRGAWVSTLTVHALGKARDQARSWFWLDVEFLGSPANGSQEQEPAQAPQAGVPRLARALLDAVDARDSLAHMRATPILVRPPDVDALIETICDPDRRTPALIASASSRHDFHDWRAMIAKSMRNAAGLASLYLLGPHATDQFNDEVGDSHGVWGGAVRTYLPGADPASAEDALRHRVQSAPRIEDNQGRARALLAGLPRRLSAEARLPRPLTGLSRALLANESPQERPELAPSVDVEKATESFRVERDHLQSTLDAALELVAEAERTEELLAHRNEELNALTAEFDRVNQRAESLEDQVRALRRRLVEVGRSTEAYAPADEQTILPTSFEELLERIDGLERIDFSGDRDHPRGMDIMPAASS
ncbi:hypothetical protein [Actinomadura terrae]|uniref:hypothetical protein n=1 Tax=Actinomadura terrae TaxID=604353 RepID=UPI001FA7478B|nr:hypothetical protein [Actinomadura terrae]